MSDKRYYVNNERRAAFAPVCVCLVACGKLNLPNLPTLDPGVGTKLAAVIEITVDR